MKFTIITLVVATLALMSAHNASGNAVSNAFHRAHHRIHNSLVRTHANAVRRERADQVAHRSYHYNYRYAPHTYGHEYYGHRYYGHRYYGHRYYGHGDGYMHHLYHGSHL